MFVEMNKGYVKYGLCDKIQSKMIKAQCEEYGLPYYETSHGREKVMDEFKKLLSV